MWIYLPMYSSQAKRKKRVPSGAKPKKPFRTPYIAQPQAGPPGILRQTNTEKKVIFFGSADAVNTNLAFNSTGTITCINLIQVGSSMFNRIGRKIEMKSVRLCGQINQLAVTRTQLSIDYARVMIIYDRQTNGAFPALADILQDTEQSGVNTTNAFSSLNMNNRERFVTIMDKRFTLPQATNTLGAITLAFPNDVDYPMKIDEFRKLRGLTTHYRADSNPAVIGDISTGSLLVLSVSLVAAGQDIWEFSWNARLKYVDV